MFEGEDLIAASDAELRAVRGNDVAMIFQDPLSSLHPFYKVGTQLVEAIQTHQHVSRGAAWDRAGRAARAGRHPRGAQAHVALPARVLRRHAPARDDRHGAVQRPQGADRRRAHHGARRDRAGADPRAHRQAAGRAGHGRGHHHPRPRRGGRGRRRDRGHVRRADRRAGQRPTRCSTTPQHPYTWGLLESIPRARPGRATRSSSPSPGARRASSTGPRAAPSIPAAPTCARPTRRRTLTLEPLPEDAGHRVACLLAHGTRRDLWAKLRAGEEPEQARAEVPLQ